MEHLTIAQHFLFVFIYIIAGLLTGYFGAFFGVGGGTILVPVLLAIFGLMDPDLNVDMHQAIAASLALVIFNTFIAARTHYKANRLHMRFFRGWAVAIFVGSIIGAVIMSFVSSHFLKILFTAYLFAAGIYQTFKRVDKPGLKEATERLPHGIVKSVAAVIIGALSVLMGLAGGTFATPFLTFFDYPMKRAMAISVAGGCIIGIVGTAAVIAIGWGHPHRVPISFGYVPIIPVVVAAPFIVLSSPYGVRSASRLPNKMLKWFYVAFLFAVAIYMVIEVTLDVK